MGKKTLAPKGKTPVLLRFRLLKLVFLENFSVKNVV